jgi:hypothetical protein
LVALGGAQVGLAIEHQAEAVLEGEISRVGVVVQFREGPGHALQAELVQPVEGRVGEHHRSPQW